MDILLIQPPVIDFYFTKKRSIPYGLLSIASALKKSGFNAGLLDCLATRKSRPAILPPGSTYIKEFYGNEDNSPISLFHDYKHYGYSYEYIREFIKKTPVSIFGISSLFTAYSTESHKIARIIKEINNKNIVIIGGHHPTILPESVLSDKNVDFVIRGEGEFPLTQLVSAIKTGSDYRKIEGVCYREKEKNKIKKPYIINNPENFLNPELSLLNHKFYSRSGRGSTVIVSSRGCPMKCKYCCVSKDTSKYRRRDVDSIIEEIKTSVKKYNAGFIDFEDENISLNRSWFKELLLKIIKNFSEFDIELRAMNGLFPPTIKKETVELMKKAGFKTLNLSLGSFSENNLKLFGRPDIKDSLISLTEECAENNLETITYIITGADKQDPYDSLDDLISIAKLKTIAGVSAYYPAPGSIMYDDLKKEKKLPENFDLYRSSLIPTHDQFKRVETVTIMRIGRIVNYIKYSLKNSCDDSFHIENEKHRFIIEEFFKDGKIRGIDENGEIYSHKISDNLTNYFLKKIEFKDIRI